MPPAVLDRYPKNMQPTNQPQPLGRVKEAVIAIPLRLCNRIINPGHAGVKSRFPFYGQRAVSTP